MKDKTRWYHQCKPVKVCNPQKKRLKMSNPKPSPVGRARVVIVSDDCGCSSQGRRYD